MKQQFSEWYSSMIYKNMEMIEVRTSTYRFTHVDDKTTWC